MANEQVSQEVTEQAYVDAATALVAANLIEEEAAEEVAAVLATALAVEEAALEEAAEVVAMAEAIEDEAMREAAEAVEAAQVIEAAAALEVAQVLMAAELIEEEAAEEAAQALTDAEIVKEAAAEEAVEALIAAGMIEQAAAQSAVKALHTAKKDQIEALYVQTAGSVSYQAGRLTLNGLAPNTLYFSDRPDRVVGHVTSEEFLDAWGEGDDSFADDPPNADLSILGKDDITNIVLVLSEPALDGETISYHVEILEGDLPASGGPSALFIDTIGRPLSPVSVAGMHRRTRRRTRRRR